MFSDEFNTFVNQQFIKEYKNVFKLAFSFSAFPKIPEILETHMHKEFIFQPYCKGEMSWNKARRLNYESKMLRNPEIALKIGKLKCHENFLTTSRMVPNEVQC